MRSRISRNNAWNTFTRNSRGSKIIYCTCRNSAFLLPAATIPRQLRSSKYSLLQHTRYFQSLHGPERNLQFCLHTVCLLPNVFRLGPRILLLPDMCLFTKMQARVPELAHDFVACNRANIQNSTTQCKRIYSHRATFSPYSVMFHVNLHDYNGHAPFDICG